MKLSRKIIAISLLWLVALVALGTVAWLQFAQPRLNEQLASVVGPGDYVLETTDGQPFTEATLKGQPTAVFFGFTHCPEVCPTTLGDIASWQEQLGKGRQIRSFFVTVDPERDTVDQLREYVTWVPGAQGVSGSRAEIDKAIRAFRIYANRIPLDDGDYTMDHSTHVLLFDASGRFYKPIGYQENLETALRKIREVQDL